MRDTMRHRGPDETGIWVSGDRAAGLAHTRLAIIDLSPGGHQPMADESGLLQIVFNGEIYNYLDLRAELEARGHRFRTSSDTEVILEAYRAWGTDCLNRLNGMFAFALYDSETSRLFLARDRAGEKPLFYAHRGGKLFFASELKALMASSFLPRNLDLDSLQDYLAYGYVIGNKCILEGVKKLPPGSAMTYDVKRDYLHLWKYWELPFPSGTSRYSDEELVGKFEALLTDSVRRQLVADVPVGILLSGGIDSSLITALAAGIGGKPVKTFTIVFPQDKAYDEGPYARLIADHFGTTHTELEGRESSADLFPTLAAQFDEPIADSSMVPTYLVSSLIRQHATVALGGDGGDELFGGYGHYKLLERKAHWQRRTPKLIQQCVGVAATAFLPVGFKGRNYLAGFRAPARASISHTNLFFNGKARKRLLAPLVRAGWNVDARPEEYKNLLFPGRDSLIQQATATDFMTYLPDDILVKVDRASMLASLEVRAPFLDYRIVEFAFRNVPDNLRATRHGLKLLPRLLAKKLLPPSFNLDRKQGFSVPMKKWFSRDWGNSMISVLREADPRLFNRDVIEELISGQRKGFANGHRLFALTMFELWRRHYKIEMPSGARREIPFHESAIALEV